jgi:hypothetical protein
MKILPTRTTDSAILLIYVAGIYHKVLVRQDEFMKLVRENQDFAADLIDFLARPKCTSLYRCHGHHPGHDDKEKIQFGEPYTPRQPPSRLVE